MKINIMVSDNIIVSPVVNSSIGSTVPNIALFNFMTENYVEDVLISFDDVVSNPDYDLSLHGFIASKTSSVKKDYIGTAIINEGNSEVLVTLNGSDSEISSDSVVTIAPYKTQEIL